ncbi:hypothetical protein M514_04349, partial [Trichuris suis]
MKAIKALHELNHVFENCTGGQKWMPTLNRISGTAPSAVKWTHTPLQPVPFPSAAWDKLGVDIVGPLQGMSYGHRFAVTMIDYYSKWPEVHFCQQPTTKEVLNFFQEIFSRDGYPSEIVTDNGKQFTSYEFKRFLEEHAIRHSKTSLYYPQVNGEVERFNRTLKDALQAAQIGQHSKLLTVKQFLMNYRATPHCVTGANPSLLLHGRSLRTKLHATVTPKSVDDQAVRARVRRKQDYMSRYSDGRRKLRPPNFVHGDMVRIRQLSALNKPWYSQPLAVHRQLRKAKYLLSNGRVWNAANLSRF